MRLARSKSRIIGLQTGHISVELTGGSVILRTKFALLNAEGETSGYFEKSRDWSDSTNEALQKFIESLEADAFPTIFEEEPETPGTTTNEPNQI